jgi:type VI protein secretion system component Hcp
MVIWKHPDAGSPKLLQAALTGEAIKSGTLNVQQPAGSKLIPYTEIL